MILILIGFLILILILNKTSDARKHSEECHVCMHNMGSLRSKRRFNVWGTT